VLAAFMAGLGVGAALAARWADRVARPLAVYGVLEIVVGGYALAFPWMVDGLVQPLLLAVHRHLALGSGLFGALQALVVGLLLVVPTAAMGATLPLLALLVTERARTAGDRIGLLYAVNTAGAVAGTAAAGLVALPLLGLAWTTRIAALCNVLLGIAALKLDARVPRQAVLDDLDPDLIGGEVRPEPLALVVIALGGAAALACEVVWSRLVGLVLGGTTYAFTAMLLAVLCGIAIGGRLGGAQADTALRRGGSMGVLRLLASVELALALTVWGLTFLWPELPYWFVWLYDAFEGKTWVGAPFATSLLLCVLVLLPPAGLMGAALPIAVRAAAGNAPAFGRSVGAAYAANTLGGVVGSAVAGFVALPWLGLRTTVAMAVALNLVGAALCFARSGSRTLAVALLVGVGVPFVVQAPWNPMWMSGGMYQYVSQFDDHSREGMMTYAQGDHEVVFYEEGLSTVVLVGRNPKSGNLWLANNGKVDASTAGDLRTQILISLVPGLFHEAPAETLVVGMASGITAGAATKLPHVKHVEVVELEPAIFKAARAFEGYNWGVLDHPAVSLVANDGRNHVLRAQEGTWDLVINEPPNPYLSGVANLFTQDFWEMGRTRLKSDGVWAQWLQVYGMQLDDLKSLTRTFAASFPHVVLCTVSEEADLLLLGSDRPLVLDFAAAERLFDDPIAREALQVAGVGGPEELVAAYAMDGGTLRRWSGPGALVRDDNMRIEFRAPLSLHRTTMVENWAAVLEGATVPWSAVPGDAVHLDALATAYEEASDPVRAERVRAKISKIPSASPGVEAVEPGG
jgi:spermidine synthase